ncbi:molybdopterin-dependent oxidoreductase [Mesorhizobium sp. MSK_1335]|uniref:Molybdopterin-dependent oxidoreductase n=1 Tax=Mesorhizobium montanum TaxID=3072323 RepID=A0ABU4ZV73_9HYPH|nr:molybdopterin cofactor-binding domain-containing protein [Mesorhizobium sp. MSK_1335]MDX8528312.1 molybdopterin-dependent oxidoreductase [Mesorhizobium sp. MSK_1335]
MNQLSRRVPLVDGVAKLTGALRFTADLHIDGLLHGALVLSTHPHARVVRIDTAAALAIEGVHEVFWHGNTPSHHYNSSIWFSGQKALADEQMFPQIVRHVGDRVAAVVADTEEIARHAARLIEVDYLDLPAIFDPEVALGHAGLPLRDDDTPTFLNPVAGETFVYGDLEAGFAAADLIVETRVTTPRSHHCAVETHACIARPEPDGRILILSPCQSVFAVQAVVGQALGLAPEKIRVQKTPIGGSFGGKAEPILDPLCAFFALQLRRPVIIRFDRHETFTATRTRSSVTGWMRTGFGVDGRILARETYALVDIGAYCTGGNYLPSSMLQRLVRLYDVPAERYSGRAVYTNTVPAGAFRGYGSPQIHTIAEISLDIAARRMGMDPVALRQRNLVGPGAIEPWQGLDLGNARGRECLARGAEAFGWAGRYQKGVGRGRWRRGVGVASATHINGCYPGFHEETTASLRLLPNGRAELVCALHDLGCGADTTLSQIAAETLGLRACDIVIVPADTDTCPYDLGTRASRMTYICGEAIRRAGVALAKSIRAAAGLELNTPADDLCLEAGTVRCRDDAGITLTDLAARLDSRGVELPTATESYRAQANPGSYAAHFAEVEVDRLTGRVKVTDYVAAHDVGWAINPMLVEGQIHGGIQIGIGYALYEDVAIDRATGRMRGDSFSRYTLANAPEMPPIRVLLVEEGEPTGPFGAKAVGEIATIPVAAAVVNAVNNALGTELTELPLSPERVVAAIG